MKLILVSGFLGSGKTTAIRGACQELMKRGVNVGVITNDQGRHLVDSEYIRSSDIPIEEVTGGCFCCQYYDLEKSIQTLRGTCRPQILFAESVGSCTDLIATVVNPLQMFYPSLKVMIFVFADASLLMSMLQKQGPFDESLFYIYQNQLAEADIMIINKSDLLSSDELHKLGILVEENFPSLMVRYQNSMDPDSICEWIETLQQDVHSLNRKSLSLDYDRYAKGEEKLAWMDLLLELKVKGECAFLQGQIFAEMVYEKINRFEWSIGHLKFLLSNKNESIKLSFTHTDKPNYAGVVYSKSNRLNILVNARVQTTPELLEKAVLESVAEFRNLNGFELSEKHCYAFKPGYPKPIHRLA